MKIIVSDFDGTLYGSHLEEDVKAIREFVKKGNLFVIATGRAINTLADDISMTNLECEFYICNDGAVIFDRYFNVLYRKDIDQEVVRPIFYMLSDDENMLETFIDTSHGYVTDTSKCANGIIARPFDREKALVTLDTILRKYPAVNGYMSTNWINIMDKDVSKKTAIDYLVDTYHFHKEDIYTIGNGLNDYSMIEAYQGYVVGDQETDLDKVAKGKVSSIQELIEMIEKEEE